ncbi:MAG: hypothetical protein WAV32_04320 [Halobacteriota archaeon]
MNTMVAGSREGKDAEIIGSWTGDDILLYAGLLLCSLQFAQFIINLRVYLFNFLWYK